MEFFFQVNDENGLSFVFKNASLCLLKRDDGADWSLSGGGDFKKRKQNYMVKNISNWAP